MINICVPAASSHKRKSKKKSKPTAAPTASTQSLCVDSSSLCFSYQEVMVAGLSLLGVDSKQHKGQLISQLINWLDE